MKLGSKVMVILVLTAIMSLMALGGTGHAAENGLVFHYKFNGNFDDSSGNSYNGSVVGAVTLGEDNIVGNHAVFNGGYLNVAKGSDIHPVNQFTLSAWVLVDAAKGGNRAQSIFAKMNDSGTYNIIHAFARGTFGARMDVQFVKGGNYLVTGGAFDNYGMGNNWTHLLFACDGERLYLYVNGALKGSSRDIQNGSSIVSSNGKVRIGTGNDMNNQNLFFMGKMADLRLYNRALSVGEIQSLYNAGAKNAE